MIAIGFLLTLVNWFLLSQEFALDSLIGLIIGVVMMMHKVIGHILTTLWSEYIERKRHTK